MEIHSLVRCIVVAVLSAVLGLLEGMAAKRYYHLSAGAVVWYPLCMASGILLAYIRYGMSWALLWGVAFLIIALFFSTEDIVSREVSDLMHGLIFVLGCFRLSTNTWKSMLLGFVICSLPLLLLSVLKGGGIGGADIKCMAAIGWALGWRKSIGTLAVGCVLILFGTLFSALRQRKKAVNAPMVPYLCASAMLMYTIF